MKNSKIILYIGIAGLATLFIPPISMIVNICGLVMGSNAKSTYKSAPEKYTDSSLSNVKAGWICSWIGLALSLIILLIVSGVETQNVEGIDDDYNYYEGVEENYYFD